MRTLLLLILNPADNFPSLILAFTSKTMNTSEISAYINSELTPKLLAQGGLSEINVWGICHMQCVFIQIRLVWLSTV